jgi:excisionase family DNA binding protein
MQTTVSLPVLWNVREAARALSLSTVSVYRMASEGALPAVRIGGRVLFAPMDIQAYIRSRRTRGATLQDRNGDLSPRRSSTDNPTTRMEKGNEL